MEFQSVGGDGSKPCELHSHSQQLESGTLLVLKFGSSVLRDLGDLPAVAGELYRQRRMGRQIIAVVSALGTETDYLFQEAKIAAGGIDCKGAADLVSLGEERAMMLLRIACKRIGLPAGICRAEELGIEADGSEQDANYVRLAPKTLLSKLDEHGLVIVPGFVGTSSDGRRLLGRGGSDFTAAILGGELGADCVRLYKDVDGVFDQDPAVAPNAHKFESISYAQALAVARPLVHSKAIEFAASRDLPIEGQPLVVAAQRVLAIARS